MRVFLVIDSLASSGGAEQALAAIAPGLVESGIDLIVQPVQDRPGIEGRLTAAGAVVMPSLPPGRARQCMLLRKRLRATTPDLVHTTLFESDVVGRPAARLAGVRVVSSLVNVAYGPEQRRHLPTPKVRAAQGLDVLTARLPVRFQAITEHVRDTMSRRLLIPKGKVDVIPRGRDPRVLGDRSDGRARETRSRLGVFDGLPLLVSAARHEYQKGLDVALHAVARVAATGAPLSYVIAGRTGNETSRLQEIISSNGLDGVVHLLGARDDVADLLAAADVFIAPSRWEGLGSAVVEAMALRAPLLVSDVPAIRETVGGDLAATLVPADDVDALAEGIGLLLVDRGLALAKAELAYRRFTTQYTLASVLDQTLAFYRRATG